MAQHKHNASKTDHPLGGVTCNVANCVFHDNHYECTASNICIDPDSAITSRQTACSTFKSKSHDEDDD